MPKTPGNPSSLSTTPSPIDSLKFSTFNYFGLGAVLTSVAQSFWINFSAYYLNNVLPDYGNLVFLVAQLCQGLGILVGWVVLAKLGGRLNGDGGNGGGRNGGENGRWGGEWLRGINLYMVTYIVGAILLITFLPLVFLLPITSVPLILLFSTLSKTGSGLMLISQLTIIPKITLNRNRRRKLVQKITQYGLAGTFVSMLVMTVVSTYVNFVWKYFFGVCGFVAVGGLCSVVYAYKVRELVVGSVGGIEGKDRNGGGCGDSREKEESEGALVQCSILKSPKFYIYGIILILCSLYMDIVISVYPYFIKSFHNISHLRYLTSITTLYLSSLLCSTLTKNTFIFTSIRSTITTGFLACIAATILLVIGLLDREFDSVVVIGTCLTGVGKVIAMNCVLNLVNQFVGRDVVGREFVYGFYYFGDKVVTGIVLFFVISRVYGDQDDVEFLHFSQIYLPFILYSVAWMLIMVQRTLSQKLTKTAHIIILQPHPCPSPSPQLPLQQQISPKMQVKYNNWINKE